MAYADRDYGSSVAIGTVLGRAFGVMTGNPLTVFGISFLFGALPQGLMEFFGPVETGGNSFAELGLGVVYIAYAIFFILCSGLAQAALVRASGAFLQGRAAGIGECIAAGIPKALPAIGVIILFVLAFMLGFALFVIPGMMLMVRWAVVLPALVEDDTGVTEAFSRSSFLTKGARWQILGLMFVGLIINWLIALVAFVPGLMMGLNNVTSPSIAGVSLSMVSSTLSTALWSTILTSLYFTLRENREGPQTERLAEVFA